MTAMCYDMIGSCWWTRLVCYDDDENECADMFARDFPFSEGNNNCLAAMSSLTA